MAQSTYTIELSEAQVAYQVALQALNDKVQPPGTEVKPVVVDPSATPWPGVLRRALVALPRMSLRGAVVIGRQVDNEIGDWLRVWKGRLARFAVGEPAVLGGVKTEERDEIRRLLLEALWARDHVQETIERKDGASYASKREALQFVMDNEARLHRLGQRALEIADLNSADLRDMQPTPPQPEQWWWFVNYPRARRARRMNSVWFALALLPALASIVLITLLAQRLAINGPDLLSSASVLAQVGLGLASIIAGREILRDLILAGVSGSYQGKLSFLLASLFLLVTVIFYFVAPPGAALIYNLFGQRAINAGNAAEAELYLESAARLDPDPHAGALLEVGCLYQTLGAPDRAQSVFERVLEADSRLLLARYHLAQIYTDRGNYGQALQLSEDGLNLLDTAREDMAAGAFDFLPGVDSPAKADEMEYLLRLARGRAYLESDAPEQAKTNLRDAEDLLNALITEAAARGMTGVAASDETACALTADRRPFVIGTQLNMHYYLALTYDRLCDDEATVAAAQEEWRLVRNGRPSNSRQEAWRDDAVRRLSSGETCRTNYGLSPLMLSGLGGLPSRR